MYFYYKIVKKIVKIINCKEFNGIKPSFFANIHNLSCLY